MTNCPASISAMRVPEPQSFAQIVRNEDYCFVESSLEREKLALQLIAGERVERTEWFIHQQDLRGQRQGHEPLPLAAAARRKVGEDSAKQFLPSDPTNCNNSCNATIDAICRPAFDPGTRPMLRSTVKWGNKPIS